MFALVAVTTHQLLFFFQAEDGIRDDLVTGVQTCALPISLSHWRDKMSLSACHTCRKNVLFTLDTPIPVLLNFPTIKIIAGADSMLTRRSFLTSAAAAGVFFIPATRLFGQDLKGPASQQFRFAGIGVGGMGTPTCEELIAAGGTIVALCDVDPRRLAEFAKDHPGIPTFTDYRVLFDKCSDTFDGVAISTPDHTHAIIALEAMRRGKAVYVQKPLARTFEECQLLMEEQARTGVVVQMGNQGHPGVLRYNELLKENAWGDIQEIIGWSDRPVWPQGMTAYPPAQPVPAGLDWDLWTGPSPLHAYSSQIHPFHWRGYWDYGCGAIGDMAVH